MLTRAAVQPGPSNPASSSSHLDVRRDGNGDAGMAPYGLKNMYDTTKGDAKS